MISQTLREKRKEYDTIREVGDTVDHVNISFHVITKESSICFLTRVKIFTRNCSSSHNRNNNKATLPELSRSAEFRNLFDFL